MKTTGLNFANEVKTLCNI